MLNLKDYPTTTTTTTTTTSTTPAPTTVATEISYVQEIPGFFPPSESETNEAQNIIFWLLRDRHTFKRRLNHWMKQLIASVLSVQESAVTNLPCILQPDRPSMDHALVPPLPLGPNERARYHADGEIERVSAEELSQIRDSDGVEAEQDLHYYVPSVNDGPSSIDDSWPIAVRANLPLRNNAGEVVTEDQWKAEHLVGNTGLWTRKISEWSAGR